MNHNILLKSVFVVIVLGVGAFFSDYALTGNVVNPEILQEVQRHEGEIRVSLQQAKEQLALPGKYDEVVQKTIQKLSVMGQGLTSQTPPAFCEQVSRAQGDELRKLIEDAIEKLELRVSDQVKKILLASALDAYGWPKIDDPLAQPALLEIKNILTAAQDPLNKYTATRVTLLAIERCPVAEQQRTVQRVAPAVQTQPVVAPQPVTKQWKDEEVIQFTPDLWLYSTTYMRLQPLEMPENSLAKASFLVLNTESTPGLVSLSAFVDDTKVAEGTTAGKVMPDARATVWVDIPALPAGQHVLRVQHGTWSKTIPLTVVASKPAGMYDVAVEIDPQKFILSQSQYVTQLTPAQAKDGFFLMFAIKNKGTVDAQPVYTVTTPDTVQKLPKSVGNILGPGGRKDLQEIVRIFDPALNTVTIEATPTASEGKDSIPENNVVVHTIPIVEPSQPAPVVPPVSPPAPVQPPQPAPVAAPVPAPVPAPAPVVQSPVSQPVASPASLLRPHNIYMDEMRWEQNGQRANQLYAEEPIEVRFMFGFFEPERVPAFSIFLYIDNKLISETKFPASTVAVRLYPARISVPNMKEGKYSFDFRLGLFEDPSLYSVEILPARIPDIEVSPEKLVTPGGEYWLVQDYYRLPPNKLRADLQTTARVWVRNIGKASASPTIVATVDGVEVSKQEVKDLDADFRFRTLDVGLNALSEGKHAVKIRAVVPQDKEAKNNELSVDVDVQPRLMADIILFRPDDPDYKWLDQGTGLLASNELKAGIPTKGMLAAVSNLGQVSASPVLVVRVDGVEVSRQEVKDVAPNMPRSNVPFDVKTLSEGRHTITIRAELDKDSNKDNNEITAPVYVNPGPQKPLPTPVPTPAPVQPPQPQPPVVQQPTPIQPVLPTPQPVPQLSCTDSDGGKDHVRSGITKGVRAWWDVKQENVFDEKDTCTTICQGSVGSGASVSGPCLIEYYCSSHPQTGGAAVFAAFEVKKCEHGCQNGVCLSEQFIPPVDTAIVLHQIRTKDGVVNALQIPASTALEVDTIITSQPVLPAQLSLAYVNVGFTKPGWSFGAGEQNIGNFGTKYTHTVSFPTGFAPGDYTVVLTFRTVCKKGDTSEPCPEIQPGNNEARIPVKVLEKGPVVDLGLKLDQQKIIRVKSTNAFVPANQVPENEEFYLSVTIENTGDVSVLGDVNGQLVGMGQTQFLGGENVGVLSKGLSAVASVGVPGLKAGTYTVYANVANKDDVMTNNNQVRADVTVIPKPVMPSDFDVGLSHLSSAIFDDAAAKRTGRNEVVLSLQMTSTGPYPVMVPVKVWYATTRDTKQLSAVNNAVNTVTLPVSRTAFPMVIYAAIDVVDKDAGNNVIVIPVYIQKDGKLYEVGQAPKPTPQPAPVPQLPQPQPPAPKPPQPVPLPPVTPPKPPVPAPAPVPTPQIPVQLPCPSVDSRGWECFKRDRYVSCPVGFEIAVPLASTSCTFCCMPVQKPTCKIDISNCPDYIKRAYTTTLLVGTPSKGGDMCEITDHGLIAVPTLSIAQYYWKFNAPCGRVLQRK